MDKRELRETIKTQKTERFLNNDKEYYLLSSQIMHNVLQFPLHISSEVIALFASKKVSYEVYTDGLFSLCIQDGKTVYLPRCILNSHTLEFVKIKNLYEELEVGAFSLREPKLTIERENQEFVLRKINLVYVPGIAFDISGNRLGFGTGYYDNFLKKIRSIHSDTPIVGLSFNFQVFKTEIPHNAKDEKVDYIITPTGIFKTKA